MASLPTLPAELQVKIMKNLAWVDMTSLRLTSHTFNDLWHANHTALLRASLYSLLQTHLPLSLAQAQVCARPDFCILRHNTKRLIHVLASQRDSNKLATSKARNLFARDLMQRAESIHMLFWANILFQRAYYLLWLFCVLSTNSKPAVEMFKQYFPRIEDVIRTLPFYDLLAIYTLTRILFCSTSDVPETGGFAYLIPDNFGSDDRIKSFPPLADGDATPFNELIASFRPEIEEAMMLYLPSSAEESNTEATVARPKTLYDVLTTEFLKQSFGSELKRYRNSRYSWEIFVATFGNLNR
jgi:hypothetical protein